MRYIMNFKDSLTGVGYIPRDSETADLDLVKEFLKAYSGLGWLKRRSHIRELEKYGATGNVPKSPREGHCTFLIVRLG